MSSNIIIKQIAVGPMANFAYIVGDNEALVCAVIDPGWDAKNIAKTADDSGFKITKILLTHAHFDHAQALGELEELTHAEIYLHESESEDVNANSKIKLTKDGDIIDVGNLKIKCLHTPGHTPGSQCFLVDGALFTGDTLFVEGCGRVDLPGSSPHEMMKSLKILASLPPETVVYPGHDYGSSAKSTIGVQLRSNPYLKK